MKSLYICLLLLPGFIPGSDNEAWTLKKMKDGIVIYNRHSNLSKFNDIRVEVDLPGTIDQLSAILLDVEKYPGWVYATKSSTMMKRVNDYEVIYYSEIGTPWPAANRDYYADMKVSIQRAAHTLYCESIGMKDYQPEKKRPRTGPDVKKPMECDDPSRKPDPFAIHLTVKSRRIDTGMDLKRFCL